MSKESSSDIIADGERRAAEACTKEWEQHRPIEVAAIKAEFASQYASAGRVRRLWLRWRMARVLAARKREFLQRRAPQDGLYLDASLADR